MIYFANLLAYRKLVCYSDITRPNTGAVMTTTQPKAPRKTPQRLSLRDQLAHDHSMAVLQSTATIDILEADGKRTDRLLYVSYEYADKKLALMGGAS